MAGRFEYKVFSVRSPETKTSPRAVIQKILLRFSFIWETIIGKAIRYKIPWANSDPAGEKTGFIRGTIGNWGKNLVPKVYKLATMLNRAKDKTARPKPVKTVFNFSSVSTELAVTK